MTRTLLLLSFLAFTAMTASETLGQAHSLKHQSDIAANETDTLGNSREGRQVSVTYTFKNAKAKLVESWFRLTLLPSQRMPIKIEMANSRSIHMSGLDRDVDAMLNLIRKVDFGNVPSNFDKDRDGDLEVEWRLFIPSDQSKHLDVKDLAMDITISNGIAVAAGQPKHLDEFHKRLRAQAHDLFETRVWRCHSMQQIQTLEKSAVDAGIIVVDMGTEKDVRSTTYPFVMVVAGLSSVFEDFDMAKAGSPAPQVEPIRFQLRDPLVSVRAAESDIPEIAQDAPVTVGSIAHLTQHLETAELHSSRLTTEFSKNRSSVSQDELKSALAATFVARVGLQKAQLAVAQKNLDDARQRLKDREDRMKEIVDGRLVEIQKSRPLTESK